MKFALRRCSPVLVALFAASGLTFADAQKEGVTISSGIVGPDGTVVLLDGGDSPAEEVVLSADADVKSVGNKVEIVTNFTAMSRMKKGRSSDDDIDPELEAWVKVSTGGEAKKPKYNRRLKKNSRKKLKIAIGLITSGADYCKKNPYVSETVDVQYPEEVDTKECKDGCWYLFGQKWCDRCCPAGFQKNPSGKCWAWPHKPHCPDGFEKVVAGCKSNSCKLRNAGGGPGGRPMGMPDEDGKDIEAQENEEQEYVASYVNVDSNGVQGKEGDVGAQQVINGGCPPGYYCVESEYECEKWANEYCSDFNPTIFTEACGGPLDRFCGTSPRACGDMHWEYFKLWAEFVSNLIPGGKGTTKLIKQVAKSQSKKSLRKALQYMGRKAVRQMKKKFKKEYNALKKELKGIVRGELEDQVDAVIDDVLVELSIDLEREEQDDPSVGEQVKEAFEEFANALSPFDFKAFQELEASSPPCAEVTLQGDDMEFEDPQDGLENVAVGKPTQHSSQYISGGGDMPDSGRAVDGNLSGEWEDMSVTQTDYQYEPWWFVVLKRYRRIRKIIIHNRTDCCQERLRDFKVELINQYGNVLWSARYTGTPGHMTTFDVNGVWAYKVKVSLPGRTDYLTLAEVEVIADAA